MVPTWIFKERTSTVKRNRWLRRVTVAVVAAAVSGRVTRILVEPGTVVDANTAILDLKDGWME